MDRLDPHETASNALTSRRSVITERRAQNNVDKWGQQGPNELLAALIEELSEILEHTTKTTPPATMPNDPEQAIWSSMRETYVSGVSIQYQIDNYVEPEDDLHIPEPDDMDVEEVRDELYDLIALCHQLDWALYQGVRSDE